jgi:2-oxoglutarate ferredoxin oxidoreductase subunit alpha
VVSYGITSRVAQLGVERARQQGVKVGTLRLVVCWPFPEARVRELARGIKAFVVPEINFGQMSLEVERCAAGNAATIGVPHAGGGVHDPEAICQAILRAAR